MALIGKTMEQIKAEKEREYQKRKKQMENKDVMTYTLRIPTHINLKFKSKLLKERKNMREVLLKAINDYIEND